jgi:hypothetical protein
MAFDESKHPRHPKGTPDGGKFMTSARAGAGVSAEAGRTEREKDLEMYLKQVAEISRQKSREAWVLEHGQFWDVGEVPDKIPAGKYDEKKGCFGNAANLSFDYPEYSYVEGYAMPGFINLPLPHAWVVDYEGKVIDTTWDDGVAYYGVEFSREQLSEILLDSGTYGVIDFMKPNFRKMSGWE